MTFWWWLRSLLLALVAVPVLAHDVALGGLVLGGLFSRVRRAMDLYAMPTVDTMMTVTVFVLGGMVMLALGWLWARFTRPEENNAARQSILLAPALLVLSAWIVVLHLSGLSFVSGPYNYLFFLTLPWFGISVLSFISGWLWGVVLIPVGAQACFTLGCYWRNRRFPDAGKGRKIRGALTLLLLALSLAALYQASLRADKFPAVAKAAALGEEIDRWEYVPAYANNRLTPLRGESQVRFTGNWPRLDGATAAFPLYASALYGLSGVNGKSGDPDLEDKLYNSRTPEAYGNIIDGSVDMIFVAQPSAGQKKRAEEAQVSLSYTPFAREAFVFIVNADNPVQSLTEQQVRDIFSGKITRWRDVGGDDGEIQTWQRPEDSGSQTAMLAKVMKGTPMLPPKENEVAAGMGGLIRRVADYQNTRGAIGYTFRYYATRMNNNSGIKLLAIDGVAPTEANIQNGRYPYIADVFMVTREDPTPETALLRAWFLSPQGQQLVQDVGYVPLPVAK